MPHPLERRTYAIWLYGLALLCLGCIEKGSGGGNGLAGTSTSIGTSIGGTAMLEDGRPAAGARIRMRVDSIRFRDGIPECRVFDSTVADAQGRFALSRTGSWISHLEIDCDPAGGCADASGRQVFYRVIYGKPESADISGLRLAAPGSFTGIVLDTLGNPDLAIWIGIRGTGHFTRAGGSNPSHRDFRLDGLYPGGYNLEVIRATANPDIARNMKTGLLEAKSGVETDIGMLTF